MRHYTVEEWHELAIAIVEANFRPPVVRRVLQRLERDEITTEQAVDQLRESRPVLGGAAVYDDENGCIVSPRPRATY